MLAAYRKIQPMHRIRRLLNEIGYEERCRKAVAAGGERPSRRATTAPDIFEVAGAEWVERK
jgi:hypothetical protein